MWQYKGVSQIHRNNEISLDKQALEASNRNALYEYSCSRHIKLLLLILIHLVDIWYDDKYLYKVVISTIQTPAHDLKVKIKDLEFSCLRILSEGIWSFVHAS